MNTDDLKKKEELIAKVKSVTPKRGASEKRSGELGIISIYGDVLLSKFIDTETKRKFIAELYANAPLNIYNLKCFFHHFNSDTMDYGVPLIEMINEEEVFDILLEVVEDKPSLKTLNLLAFRQHGNVLLKLFKKHPELNEIINERNHDNDYTPLMVTICKNGYFETNKVQEFCFYLLEHGGNINVKGKNGRSFLSTMEDISMNGKNDNILDMYKSYKDKEILKVILSSVEPKIKNRI